MKSLKISLLIAIFSSSISFASPDDLKGTRYKINRIEKETGTIAFEFCDLKFTPEICQYIGDETGYTTAELAEISRSELWEYRGKTAVTVVAVIGGVVTGTAGGFIFSGAIGSTTGAITFGQGATIFGFAAGGGSIPFWFKKINPFHQYDQAKVLTQDGIANKKVIIMSNEEVLKVAQLMSEVFGTELDLF